MALVVENSWRSAVKLTLPILMGYLAAGVAYGMLATAAGLPAWFTILMCFTVYSGTAQYAAIPFFVEGVGLMSAFLSIFLMSLRFLFYTLNMHNVLPENPLKKIVSLTYLTDENFALLATFPEEMRKQMIFKTGVLGMIYWAGATVIGVLIGNSASVIPHLDFALPCLFAILAYEQFRNQKQWKPMVIAAVGFVLASQITSQSVLLVAILIAIVLVAILPNALTGGKK